MTRLRWFLALPAILIAASGPSIAADIRDKADLFSAPTVKKAETELDRIETEYKVPIRIETVNSLDGQNIDDALKSHAKAADAHGLYILIAKKEHKTEVGESASFSKYITRSRTVAIRDAINAEFKKGNFDAGLTKGVDKIDSILSEARAEAGGSLKTTPATRRAGQVVAPAGRAAVAGKPSTGGGMTLILTIGLGLLFLFIVIRIISAIFSGGGQSAGYGRPAGGPGMGGPGYGGGGYGGGGGGGGGFMSSMMGGIGGALAGNWLYDQFSGRHHDAGMGQTSFTYDPGVGADAPANDDFVTPDDGGGDWGGGGGDTGGGGDWGGGGGDGGGGDWGGGGGGDWGGGGGDGGW